MPLYEYQCLNCHKIHEIMQRFSDPPPVSCPSCKGKIKKLISLSSFSLKGTGWYVTDYKGKNSSSQNSKPKPEGTVDSKSSKSAEPTPEKKKVENKSPTANLNHQT